MTAQWRMPTLSVRIPWLWLQGALILENSWDLVIPVCQSRTLWTGFFTCKAKMRMSKNVIVKHSFLKFLKTEFDRNGGVLPKKSWSFPLTFSWCSPVLRKALKAGKLNPLFPSCRLYEPEAGDNQNRACRAVVLTKAGPQCPDFYLPAAGGGVVHFHIFLGMGNNEFTTRRNTTWRRMSI